MPVAPYGREATRTGDIGRQVRRFRGRVSLLALTFCCNGQHSLELVYDYGKLSVWITVTMRILLSGHCCDCYVPRKATPLISQNLRTERRYVGTKLWPPYERIRRNGSPSPLGSSYTKYSPLIR